MTTELPPLPDSAAMTTEDLADGFYENPLECPLARALKRAGVTMGAPGYAVSNCGMIFYHNEDGSRIFAGQYRYGGGELFGVHNLRTGVLILDTSQMKEPA